MAVQVPAGYGVGGSGCMGCGWGGCGIFWGVLWGVLILARVMFFFHSFVFFTMYSNIFLYFCKLSV